jgi:hypothetical protein
MDESSTALSFFYMIRKFIVTQFIVDQQKCHHLVSYCNGKMENLQFRQVLIIKYNTPYQVFHYAYYRAV